MGGWWYWHKENLRDPKVPNGVRDEDDLPEWLWQRLP